MAHYQFVGGCMKPESTLEEKVLDLFLYRKRFQASCLYTMLFIIIYFIAKLGLETSELARFTTEGMIFSYFLIFAIMYCCVEAIWHVFKFRDVLLLKHSEIHYSRCTCTDRVKTQLLMCAIHTIKCPKQPSDSKSVLKFVCRQCGEVIYRCDI